MPTAWNLFRIGRAAGKEDQLTEMFAWLASAVPEVIPLIVRLAFEDVAAAAGRIEVSTQQAIVGGRLDAVFTSENTALVVESKLQSEYGEGQIRKYLDWLAEQHDERPHRGLMTLTANLAPWPKSEKEHAEALGITGSARRWEELHDAFEPLIAGDGLESRLVEDFLEMLSDENLIPMEPLDEEELGTAWADGLDAVWRYRDFFHSCRTKIGEALGASPIGNSGSDRGDWFWQDYLFEDGSRVVVGLFYSDEHEGLPRVQQTRSPLIFVAAKADHVEGWATLASWLEKNPPEGWTVGKRWYGERPNVWRPLEPLLSGLDTEEQRQAVACAAGTARAWIVSGLSAAGPTA